MNKNNQNNNDTNKENLEELIKLQNLKEDLKKRVFEIKEERYKSPLSLIYVTYNPEILFVRTIFDNSDLIDAFIKSPDKGFYSLPYSYSPESKSKTHVHHGSFNPDFFIKKGTDIIVVEIKKDGDDSNKNKSKLRDGLNHFNLLNKKLEQQGIEDRYYFKFLSSENNDYLNFWQSIKDNKYKMWKSTLMVELN